MYRSNHSSSSSPVSMNVVCGPLSRSANIPVFFMSKKATFRSFDECVSMRPSNALRTRCPRCSTGPRYVPPSPCPSTLMSRWTGHPSASTPTAVLKSRRCHFSSEIRYPLQRKEIRRLPVHVPPQQHRQLVPPARRDHRLHTPRRPERRDPLARRARAPDPARRTAPSRRPAAPHRSAHRARTSPAGCDSPAGRPDRSRPRPATGPHHARSGTRPGPVRPPAPHPAVPWSPARDPRRRSS